MKKNKHDKGLEKIINNPNIIGVKNPIFVAKEVNFYNQGGVGLHSQPDLLVYDGRLFIIEYKSSKNHAREGVKQLQKEMKFLREYIRYKGFIVPILITGREQTIFKPKCMHIDKRGVRHELLYES